MPSRPERRLREANVRITSPQREIIRPARGPLAGGTPEEVSMKKPYRISPDVWEQFLSAWTDPDGRIRCVVPNCDAPMDLLTVDHRVSKFEHGTDALSNLQPMCRSHNSSKGSRPDGYWSKHLYFDNALNLAVLRTSQREYVYHALLDYRTFFAQPISQISGKLYTVAQVVASGKTLAEFCIPFAINACVRRSCPAQSRIDRMLIVTKGTALRSQIAQELETEPVRYGFLHEAPTVLEITDNATLLDPQASYHIGVMCPNMLWPHLDVSAEGRNGPRGRAWIRGIERVANRHPLVIFDEMHFAPDNIREFVAAASNTLVFGFSATPFKGDGKLLDDIVLVSNFTYLDAMSEDGSMKYIR